VFDFLTLSLYPTELSLVQGPLQPRQPRLLLAPFLFLRYSIINKNKKKLELSSMIGLASWPVRFPPQHFIENL
jgi:hypothetical protein